MTDLSPEEKEKIYAEEKARIEAQDKIKAEAKEKTTKEKKRQTMGCGIGCLTLIIIFILIGIFGTEDKTPTTKLPVTKSQKDPAFWLRIQVEGYKNPMEGELAHIQLEVIHKGIVTIELIKDKQIRKVSYKYVIELLKDEDADIRNVVANALSEATRQGFGKDYDKWLEWWKANYQKDVVEVAKQNLLDVAKQMGGFDPVLTNRVIHFVEGGEMESGVPWSIMDDSMKQTTKETQFAYHKYRAAVLKQK